MFCDKITIYSSLFFCFLFDSYYDTYVVTNEWKLCFIIIEFNKDMMVFACLLDTHYIDGKYISKICPFVDRL